MTRAERSPGEIARVVLAAADGASPIAPFTDADSGFGLAAAYAVAGEVLKRRQARGETPVGWKIGFTNHTIWDEYGVHAPIWGPMFDTTTEALEPLVAGCPFPLAGLREPRIEPEIVFRLAAEPRPGMDAAALLGCVEAVGHGFEIVQSLYPGWRFRAPDTVAALALHGRYRHGPLVPLAPTDRAGWLAKLSDFAVVLSRDGAAVDRGVAANILGDGPLAALRALVDGLRATPMGLALRPGDLVTTGTLTRAFPVRPGERWRTELTGLPLPGLDVLFT